MAKKLTVQVLGTNPQALLEDFDTVLEVMEELGLDVEDNYSVAICGEDTDTNATLDDYDFITLTLQEKIKGGLI